MEVTLRNRLDYRLKIAYLDVNLREIACLLRMVKGCIYKNALKSVHDCVGCDSNGFCANEGPCDINTQFCGVNMYTVTPECYGGDVYEEADVGTLEDCIFGCKTHESCLFITYGKGRCIFKDGLTSVHECVGCTANGFCANEGTCDINTKFCAVNVYHHEEM